MKSYQVLTTPTRADWKQAVAVFPEANFLQSWEWGEFHGRLGKHVVRVIVLSEDSPVACAELVIETAKRGSYAAVAGGPLTDWNDQELCLELFRALTAVARQRGCWFLRFRPQARIEAVSYELLTQLQAVPSPMHLTADLTLQLDLKSAKLYSWGSPPGLVEMSMRSGLFTSSSWLSLKNIILYRSHMLFYTSSSKCL